MKMSDSYQSIRNRNCFLRGRMSMPKPTNLTPTGDAKVLHLSLLATLSKENTRFLIESMTFHQNVEPI